MHLLSVYLSFFIFVYLYINTGLLQNTNKKNVLDYFFFSYTFLIILVLYYIRDIYYFYLLYKLLNICIYMFLIQLATNPINFRALIYYYFIRFMSSLLFIICLYDATNGIINCFTINISILFKLRLYPFSDALTYIYKSSSFKGYIALNYYISYLYICILVYINNVYNFDIAYNYLQKIILLLVIPTLLFCYYNFNKQWELKGFMAYSSITNTPLLIGCLLNVNSLYLDMSLEVLVKTLSFVLIYVVIYSNNSLIINSYAFLLEPNKGKK